MYIDWHPLWIIFVAIWLWTGAATCTLACIKYAWPESQFSSFGAFLFFVFWPILLLMVGPAALYRRVFRRPVDAFNWN